VDGMQRLNQWNELQDLRVSSIELCQHIWTCQKI